MRMESFGQAMVEFLYFSVFSVGFVGIAGLTLKQEWNRSKCAYLVFESTHNYLTSPNIQNSETSLSKIPLRRSPNVGFTFYIEEVGHQIVGTGQCGSHLEKVRLPKLETAKW
jgi:hypothetical protein